MMAKELPPDGGGSNPCCQEKFYMGYKECQEEILHQLIDTEGLDPKDAFYQRMTNFLDQSSKKFLRISTGRNCSYLYSDMTCCLYLTHLEQRVSVSFAISRFLLSFS